MSEKTLTLNKKPDDAPAAPIKHPLFGKTVRLRTAPGYADMLHLHQNKLVDGEGKRIEIDDFAVAQLEAGKWLVSED